MRGNPGFRNFQVPKQEQEPGGGLAEGKGEGADRAGIGGADVAEIAVCGIKGAPSEARAVQELA